MSTETVQVETPETQESVVPETDGQDVADEQQQDTQAVEEQDATAEEQESASEDAKVSDNVQKRFDKLTYEKHQALREAANARKEIEAVKAEIQALKQTAQPKAEKPNYEDFDTQEEYVEALTDWKLEQRFSEQQERAQEQLVQKEQQAQMLEVRQSFEQREAEFSADKDDYLMTVESLTELLPKTENTAQIVHELLRHEQGPALLYAMGKDLDLAADVFSKPATFASQKLNTLAASMVEQPEQKQPLPKPLKPVKSGTSTKKSLEQMSPDEVLKWIKS